jgi:hypothetical protein
VLEIEAGLSGGRMLWTRPGSVKEERVRLNLKFALQNPQIQPRGPNPNSKGMVETAAVSRKATWN